ncbi:MAG: hypothetical protein CMI05_14335 [Oceanospirillaceae bacterium]|nr:hypothetical protein [Oceanospirillaceae bacterium]
MPLSIERGNIASAQDCVRCNIELDTRHASNLSGQTLILQKSRVWSGYETLLGVDSIKMINFYAISTGI